ncbi:MAG: outer membrane beta-barrel family protein, partial [Saprospiraceae bacterium]
LRAESSFYTGELLDVDSTFQNQFPLSLFPSLFLTYKINEQDNIQLNYSRRVNRPSFFQLIPFPDFSDSLLLSRGNPELRPEFTNSLEMSYQNILSAKHNYLLTVYYKQSNNLIAGYQFTEYNEFLGRDAVVASYKNANSSQAYGAEITIKNTFGKVLDVTTNLNAYNSVVDASNVEANLKIDQFTWFIKENINIKFPKSYTLQINGEYQSRTAFAVGGGNRWGGGGWHGGPSSTAQGYSIPVWFVDISLRKDILNRKGSISIAVQDIFRSRRSGAFTQSAFFTQENWRLRDPQLARLNFSYRFGKFDTSLFKRKNTRAEDGMEGF